MKIDKNTEWVQMTKTEVCRFWAAITVAILAIAAIAFSAAVDYLHLHRC
jgi:hypothetical protein